MRIVAVSWRDLAHPQAGGAELMIENLLNGLGARGHDVSLVCGGPVSTHSFEVVDAGGTFSQYLRAPAVCVARYRKADVVIDAENGLPYFSPVWRRRPSLCLVHHVHTDQWRSRFPAPMAQVFAWMESTVMPAVYRRHPFVAVSRSTSEALEAIGVRPEQITVIESGVKVPPGPLPGKSEEPLFLSLNRVVPHKRIELLVRAWEVAGRKIGGRLVIAGDGPALASVRRVAASVPGVEVAGRISEEEKADLLGRSWAVLSASHHEGWGMSITEAASFGTPAIAVDAPGTRDAVADGVTGLLVRGTDDAALVGALAGAVVEFSKDGGRREALGASARLRAEGLSWNRSIDRWESLLNQVAGASMSPVAP